MSALCDEVDEHYEKMIVQVVIFNVPKFYGTSSNMFISHDDHLNLCLILLLWFELHLI